MLHQSRFHFLSVAALSMIAAILACNAQPTASTAAPPTTVLDATGAPEASEVAPTIESTVEVPAESRFLSGTPVDVATLPTLFIPPAGIAGFCGDDVSEPTITLVNLSNVFSQLCLYQWPATDASAAGIHVDLTDPDGATQTVQFTLSPLNGGVTVLDASGGSVGNVLTPDQSGKPETVVALNVYLEANVVPGTWTVTATADDGSFAIGPSAIDIVHPGPTLSAIYNHEATLFQPQPGTYSPGDTLSMVGSSYPANTQPTLVLFRMDDSTPSQFGTPSLLPEYAVLVTTDAAGFFSVDFVVGANMPRGGYQMVADPAVAADTLVNPFMGQFTIN